MCSCFSWLCGNGGSAAPKGLSVSSVAKGLADGAFRAMCEEVFNKHDLDKDGELTKQEVQAMVEELVKLLPPMMACGTAPESQEFMSFVTEEFFSKLDSDGSGTVSKVEFKDLVSVLEGKVGAQKRQNLAKDRSHGPRPRVGSLEVRKGSRADAGQPSFSKSFSMSSTKVGTASSISGSSRHIASSGSSDAEVLIEVEAVEDTEELEEAEDSGSSRSAVEAEAVEDIEELNEAEDTEDTEDEEK